MDSLISFLCLCSFFVPSAFGVGLTLLLERSFGVRAYWIGWLLPLILLTGLYGADILWMRATPCEPAGSLECGEPAAYALILFVGTFFPDGSDECHRPNCAVLVFARAAGNRIILEN
jgi:hypothetical protein